jgi:hypothetical protein
MGLRPSLWHKSDRGVDTATLFMDNRRRYALSKRLHCRATNTTLALAFLGLVSACGSDTAGTGDDGGETESGGPGYQTIHCVYDSPGPCYLETVLSDPEVLQQLCGGGSLLASCPATCVGYCVASQQQLGASFKSAYVCYYRPETVAAAQFDCAKHGTVLGPGDWKTGPCSGGDDAQPPCK